MTVISASSCGGETFILFKIVDMTCSGSSFLLTCRTVAGDSPLLLLVQLHGTLLQFGFTVLEQLAHLQRGTTCEDTCYRWRS